VYFGLTLLLIVCGSADTGGDCWKGAMAMARFFEEEAKHAIVGKRILELASGTGILGLHLGLMGAKHIVMTDKESMKQLLLGNIAENKILLASTGKCGRIEAASLVSVPVSR
jgi:predicted nicotinamide N-methyase